MNISEGPGIILLIGFATIIIFVLVFLLYHLIRDIGKDKGCGNGVTPSLEFPDLSELKKQAVHARDNDRD